MFARAEGDDEALISVGHELHLMLYRHWDLLHARAESFANDHPRFRRILGERFFDPERYRDRTYTTEELIRAYLTMSHYAHNAFRLQRMMDKDSSRALRLAVEIMHRAQSEGIEDEDADNPFQNLLRRRADAVIDDVERMACDSFIVRRAIWRMRRQREELDATTRQRLLAARDATTDFSDDHSPVPAPQPLAKIDEEILRAWFQHEKNFWAFDEVDALVSDDPEKGWPLNLQAVTNGRLRTALTGVRLEGI